MLRRIYMAGDHELYLINLSWLTERACLNGHCDAGSLRVQNWIDAATPTRHQSEAQSGIIHDMPSKLERRFVDS